MNVKVIRMWSGEDVVADLVKEGDETITVCNPIVAVPPEMVRWDLLHGHLFFLERM